jgi:hypothetical protein
MDNTPSEGGALQKQTGQAIRFDPLNPGSNVIDLGTLTQDQQNALIMEYMRGTLDVQQKAAQMHVDVNAFENMLNVMAQKTKDIAAQEGTSVTMSHTQESSVGRTEIIMGNTQQAASGKISRTMAGERNFTWLYVTLGVVAALVLVSMFLRH